MSKGTKETTKMKELNFKEIERVISRERFMEINGMIKDIQKELHRVSAEYRSTDESHVEEREYLDGKMDGLKFAMVYLENYIYKTI